MIEERKGKVTLKQFRGNGWLPKGHDGEHRYTHCFEELVVPVDRRGTHITGLTEEDERYFEDKLNMPAKHLSRYNREYWSSFRIKIEKDGRTLDLAVPSEELEYRVLLVNKQVANSEAEKAFEPEANYVLTSLEQEAKAASDTLKVKKEAYKTFSKMTSNDMLSFLKVQGNKLSDDTSLEVLDSEVGKVVEENPSLFLSVMKDPYFKTKVFIEDCKAAGAIKKNGTKYSLTGGDIFAYSLEEAISYLSKDENQEVVIGLKSKIEVKKKK
jgi:hypothetical protein